MQTARSGPGVAGGDGLERFALTEYADAAALMEDFWAAVDATQEQIGWQ